MQSKATTVEDYLAELPQDRRAAVAAVREVILDSLPEGCAEAMRWGVISDEVPLERCPDTYDGQPLSVAARRFEDAYRATGKRFDAGKCCVRFRKLDDLPLPVVGEAIAAAGVDEIIAAHERAHAGRGKKR